MSRSTIRLLFVACPVCGVALRVSVRDVPLTMTSTEWTRTLSDEDASYLHEAHGVEENTVVDGNGTRTRTRRLT